MKNIRTGWGMRTPSHDGDDSLNLIKSLQGKVKQYAVSNGTIAAQTKKLKLSGIGELMDGIFITL